MEQPTEPQLKNILTRDVPADLVARIDAVASQERRSRNAQVIILLEEALDQREQMAVAHQLREQRRIEAAIAAQSVPLRPQEPGNAA